MTEAPPAVGATSLRAPWVWFRWRGGPLPGAGDPQWESPQVRRSFWRWVGLIAACGLAVRLGASWDFVRQIDSGERQIWGDAYFYHYSAQVIADGHGFINPLAYLAYGIKNQAADHPPLYIVFLTLMSMAGLGTPAWHLAGSCLVGTATIPVSALTARRLLGPRAGVIAAALVAFYPPVWSWDAMLLSETFAILFVAVTLLAAYRFWQRPTPWRAVWMGVGVALATLSRAELIMLSVLVVVPLVLLVRAVPLARRFLWLCGAGLACVLVLSPWVGYNLSRFEKPVLLSAGFEITLSTASCEETYYGEFTGYWSMNCPNRALERAGLTTPDVDQSLRSAALSADAREWIANHTSRLPAVTLARWGRITGLYKPVQQADLDHFPEGRPIWVSDWGQAAYFVVAALAISGALWLRRNRVAPVFPLVAPPALVLFIVTLVFAQNRYRAIAEGALCLMAAAGIERVVRWVGRVRTDPEDTGPADTGPADTGPEDAGARPEPEAAAPERHRVATASTT